MFVVTFYSYKGGVGRTSALANVAFRLARRGKRVLVMDFDLEAPGIDAYHFCDSKETHEGLVEYVAEFMRSGQVPSLRDFVLDATLPGTMGKLFFMPAGKKDESYQAELSRLDWKVFYRQKKGYLFVENLKAAINEMFKPDYVLVDSRTGLTDTSGICTLQLPSLVVLMFSLNEQNVTGTSRIYRSIKSNKINRSISTLLVASPVPDMPEWVTVRGQRFEYARKTIGSTVDVVVPYDPFLAFQESLIDYQDGEEAKTYLSKAYDVLTEKVILANGADVLTLLRKATELRDEGNLDLAEMHYREVVETRSDSPEAWIEFGKFTRLRDRPKDACELFEKALSLRPGDADILSQLATTYTSVDKNRAAEYYKEFLSRELDVGRIERVSTTIRDAGLAEASLEGYQRMIELDSRRSDSYFQMGEAHMRLHHYRQAADAYKRAADLEPTNLPAIYNAGYSMSKVDVPKAVPYFERAIELWEQLDKSSFTGATLANLLEGIGIAYLAVSKPEKAVEELKRSLTLAAGERTRLFSAIKYAYIPQPRFIEEVRQLLERAQHRLSAQASAVPGVNKADIN
jgi:tetratricopeptide (TPR) repeat protein